MPNTTDLLYRNIAKYNSAPVILHSTTRVAPYQLDINKTQRQRKETLREGRSLPGPIPKREEGGIPCVRMSRCRIETRHTQQVLQCGALAAQLLFLTARRRGASPRQPLRPRPGAEDSRRGPLCSGVAAPPTALSPGLQELRHLLCPGGGRGTGTSVHLAQHRQPALRMSVPELLRLCSPYSQQM